MGKARVILGDCISAMKKMPENSVDSIVTDPPYGLEFMGREWDHGVPGIPFWVEALRVLKPGGHMLAFGGTRTYHRLTCAIEDAGFKIRDCVMWVYGCLSDDTEVLTPDGWEYYHTARSKEVLAYDPTADVYKWEKPSRWSAYCVESDTAFRIKSDTTDQIVSRNHRCLVERAGKLAFVAAEDLATVEGVPTLPNDFFGLSDRESALLQPKMQRPLPRQGVGNTWSQGAAGVDGQEQALVQTEDVGIGQSGVEGWGNVFQDARQLQGREVCSLSRGVPADGPKRRIRDGASSNCRASDGAVFIAEGSCASQQPRSDRQYTNKPFVVQRQQGPQAVRARTSYHTSLATVTPFAYSGTIFCPTVSTGAFVARRNGKVFVTGNSGFPKSLDVSKAIDKEAGAEREVVGRGKGRTGAMAQPNGGSVHSYDNYQWPGEFDRTVPASEDARKWQGWGTALKPSWEPVILARKPLEGTVADNVQAHGTGALNIDGCRVPVSGGDNIFAKNPHTKGGFGHAQASVYGDSVGAPEYNPSRGRFPANLIHDGSEEVLAGFPQSSVTGKRSEQSRDAEVEGTNWLMSNHKSTEYIDSGSAARFFYCAKASKSDREEGLEELDAKAFGYSNQALADLKRGIDDAARQSGVNSVKMRKNTHPTVKPTDLMRYLCRLVTPPKGTVLDLFMGSGSTGKAALLEGFSFIGIEKEKQYIEIAAARLRHAQKGGTHGPRQDGRVDREEAD